MERDRVMIVSCRNDICVYWKNDECMLEAIDINEAGFCNDYISVNIPSEELEYYRKKHLDDLRNRAY